MQPQTPAARFDPIVPRPPPDSDDASDQLLKSQDHDPALGVTAVARKLGIAPATLRTWARRYGIGPACHTPGSHRRYGAEDLTRLELMRHALLRGASPASAANYALSSPLGPPSAAPSPTAAHPATAGETVADRATPADATEPATATATATKIGSSSAAADAGRRVRSLDRAAAALDAEAVRDLLNTSITDLGVEVTWDVVVRPVLGAIARRWVETGTGIEVEHLLSDCVTGVFSAIAASASPPLRTARPVLLAGMAGDQHRLPLIVLSATLAQHGVICRSLGTDLPADALIAAIRRTAPVAVLLWSQLPHTTDPDLLNSLPRTRPGFRTFVAGPGWSGIALRPQIVHLNSLREATEMISALVSA